MLFSREFIEEVKRRSEIEDVVGKYVRLKRTGSNIVGLCPFHNEKTPSFTVFPQTSSFYCFGCGAGGDVFSFIMRAEGLDYPGAVEFLARSAGVPLEERQSGGGNRPTVRRERVLDCNREAARLFHAALQSPSGAQARAYLTEQRRLTEKTIRRFGIGYAPDSWDFLHSRLTAKGYTDEELKAAFLCGISQKGHPYDVFRNRVIFPIFDLNGEVVAFAGRRLNENDERKYVNTSDTPAFKKSKVIFGMNFAKRSEAGSLIVCEGPVDAIALQQAGFDNAVATQGTAITADQVRTMSRFVKTVYLAYDIDKAGRNATMKAIQLFTQVGVAAKVIDLGTEAKDPDEYIKKFGADAFRRRLDASAGQVDFRIDEILGRYSLSLPDEKLRAVDELTTLAAGIYSKSEREVYLARMSEKTGVSAAALSMDAARKAKKAEEKQKAEQRRRTVNEALGYGDRVNRDRLTYATGALLEERLLACMLSDPALAAEACETLSEDDFLTAFGKKVFAAFAEEFAEGTEVVLSKDGLLEPEEISALARLMAKRDRLLPVMPDDAAALVRALKEERLRVEFNERIDANPQEALEEYIRLKRQKKTRPGDGGGEK